MMSAVYYYKTVCQHFKKKKKKTIYDCNPSKITDFKRVLEREALNNDVIEMLTVYHFLCSPAYSSRKKKCYEGDEYVRMN